MRKYRFIQGAGTMSLNGRKIGQIFRKISLSIKVFFLVIATGLLVIGVPLSIYDKHVIEADQKCYQDGSNPSDIINNALGTDQKRELLKKHIQLREQCHITVSRAGDTINAYSTRVIIDNSPEPTKFFWMSLLVVIFALLVHLIEKWIIWLLIDD